MIRAAVARDLPVLRDIERAAGEVFRSVGMAAVAGDEPLGLTDLARFQEDGRAWVATDDGDRAIAYLLVEELDGAAHIDQVSVHPDHARQGVGRALIDVAEAWAGKKGLTALTLTTFADVGGNALYYRRLGFTTLTEAELGPGLRRMRDQEAADRLDA